MKSILLLCFVLAIASVSGLSKVRFFGQDDAEIIVAPFDLCNYYADTDDLKTAGIVNTISAECKTLIGQTPNSVQVNADSYPYKMCLVAENATFGNLQPVDAESVVDQDSFNNTTNQNISHTFSLSGSYANSIQVSTTSTVDFSVNVAYNMIFPIAFLKFDLNTSFSSSKTTTQSTSIDDTYSSSTTLVVDPGCDYTAALSVNSLLYKAPVEVPICLTGYARCSYNKQVNGHYYWYVMIDDFVGEDQRCQVQTGALASAMSVDSATKLAKTCGK